MSVHFNDPTRAEIWNTIEKMNDCWTEGNPEELRIYFHPEMVAINPVDRFRLEGGHVCVAEWSSFARMARIRFFRESDPKVQVYGNTAVVTFYYDMLYEMNGAEVKTRGRDMMTLVRENGRWLLVADSFSEFPETPTA